MEPVETYELMTVTYGLAPSSFLTTRTLKQLAADEGNAYPLGKAALQKSFYADDFIDGAESVAEAIQLRTELSKLLAKGGFPLRKWTCSQFPPKAPHFGSLWEAAVKVAKRQLYRQLGNSELSFEDLATILAQIEASMNSRPIVPLSEDPNDISALTPAYFLIGSTMYSLPEEDLHLTSTSRLDHYQRMQKVYQQLWHHWRAEYLQELQRDNKTCQPNRCVQPGRLVLLTDELQIPVKWPLARIVAIIPVRTI
ncbi:uncharacterized protein LOC129719889 [Wyeomyia smithii]|uniref:uncharacterized protein LOC129719887 n=1 Tax=Wyeomyia smithii TaxID=174621 RepID=UPI002467B470|nr:uncharacterized protein LOC129719887 [Wyeomyia smithii]XP_055527279.1 uncharacterized protein LOC129719889 [Wyeomyia smithii]